MSYSQTPSSFQMLTSSNLRVEIPQLPLFDIASIESPPLAPRHAETKRCCMEGCKKKLALSDFPCKCGKKHCALHRSPEVHSCNYDFKQSQRDLLLKTMSTAVIAKKVDVL
jgi:hypothetical protein